MGHSLLYWGALREFQARISTLLEGVLILVSNYAESRGRRHYRLCRQKIEIVLFFRKLGAFGAIYTAILPLQGFAVSLLSVKRAR